MTNGTTDKPLVEQRIGELEHAAMNYAQHQDEHTSRRLNEARDRLRAALSAAAEPVITGWLLSGNGCYATVFLEQSEPPSPMTREEALSKGWRMVYDSPGPAPAVPDADFMQPLCRLLSTELAKGSSLARAVMDILPLVPDAAKPGQHEDDEAVDRFAQAMKEKLAQARWKGRGGWQTCDPRDLSRMLRDHVEKGDTRDVANFCMFLWNLEQRISPKTAVCDFVQVDVYSKPETQGWRADVLLLADKYARAEATARLELLYGSSERYAAQCSEKSKEARKALAAALLAEGPARGEPLTDADALIINGMWGNSGHGTRREDIESAYMAGAASAGRIITKPQGDL